MLNFWDYLAQTKKPEEIEQLKDSTGWTRSLQYGYAQLAPPTGGGNKEAMAVTNPEIAAGLKKGKLAPGKASPGMEEPKIKERQKRWEGLQDPEGLSKAT